MTVENEKINRSAWLILGTLSCLGLIAMYGETMLLPAIPALIEDFEIPYNTSAWILSTYMIAGAVATPIAGMFQQMHRGTVIGVSGSFPTPDAYNLIFLTAFAISLTSVVFAIFLNRKVTVQNN